MGDTDGRRRFSVLDLTVAQGAAIEVELGVPMQRWDDAPLLKLAPMILAAMQGGDVADYQSMTVRELSDLVSLDGSDDGSPEAGEPTSSD